MYNHRNSQDEDQRSDRRGWAPLESLIQGEIPALGHEENSAPGLRHNGLSQLLNFKSEVPALGREESSAPGLRHNGLSQLLNYKSEVPALGRENDNCRLPGRPKIGGGIVKIDRLGRRIRGTDPTRTQIPPVKGNMENSKNKSNLTYPKGLQIGEGASTGGTADDENLYPITITLIPDLFPNKSLYPNPSNKPQPIAKIDFQTPPFDKQRVVDITDCMRPREFEPSLAKIRGWDKAYENRGYTRIGSAKNVNCAGLVLGGDSSFAGNTPPETMMRIIRRTCREVDIKEAKIGDIVVSRTNEGHFALVIESETKKCEKSDKYWKYIYMTDGIRGKFIADFDSYITHEKGEGEPVRVYRPNINGNVVFRAYGLTVEGPITLFSVKDARKTLESLGK